MSEIRLIHCKLRGRMSVDLEARDVLDLLQFLNLSHNRGFHYISGINNQTTAIYLEDPSRDLELPSTVLQEALALLRENDEITFLASVKQDNGDSGTIFSFSSGLYRFLELESSGRRDEIRFHYTHDQQIRVETFPYRLADNRWHQVALTLSGSHITLFVNCSKIYERVIKTVDRDFTAGSYLSLFVGQRNKQSGQLRVSCPTCAQFQSLESKMKEMLQMYQNLTVRNGTVECRNIDCPLAECANPVYRDGECCPVCLTNCYYSGKYYDHGDGFSPRVCVTCTCHDGRMVCERQDPQTSCPKLNCDEKHVLHIQGECCPVCQGTDFCGLGNDCHSNGTCINLATRYACQCKAGFQGDGRNCEDINECLGVGGKYGHHCNGNTQCINTIGSYRCQCASGHDQTDSYTCTDIDECALGIWACRGHSVCVNDPGWYHCDCLEGFHSNWPDNSYGSLCLDTNECIGEGNGNTCPPSTICNNIEGDYTCECEQEVACVKNCISEGAEHKNDSTWRSRFDKCMQCTCFNGVTQCHRVQCNCSDKNVDKECCPQCDTTSQCHHQETMVWKGNGERWIFECQTCECLHGEIDCWPLECPVHHCTNYIQEAGDCCPRCIDDNPCLNKHHEVGGADLSTFTCMYKGQRFRHGESWILDTDLCTKCECKIGHICCTFSHTCPSHGGLEPLRLLPNSSTSEGISLPAI
ncbi:hypothetical protein ACJMK2_030360 [Sinanodonta woodiana]|uniref:Uncharacterized protein n=1 Tax=Sinanodonta woodiana TaxID=1069815 RepID=A0ABD3XGR4_SINWO